MLGIEGSLILFMYRQIHPEKKWIYLLLLVFALGFAYEIIYSFR